MTVRQRLADSFNAMFGEKTEYASVVGLSWSVGEGRNIRPSFKTQGDRVRAHPQIRYALDKFSTDITAGGFRFVSYTEEDAINQTGPPKAEQPEQVNEPPLAKKVEAVQQPDQSDEPAARPADDDSQQTDEDLATEAEKKRAKEAIKILNLWCEDADVDTWLWNSTKDLRGLGNLVTEKLYEDNKLIGLARIPTMSIRKFRVTERGRVLGLLQIIDGTRKLIPASRLPKMLHWAWNPFDNGVIGRGVMDSLCLEGPGYSYYVANNTLVTEHRPPYVEILEENEDMMRKGIHRTTPRHLYVLKAVPADKSENLTDEIKKLRPEDDIVMTIPPTKDATVEVHRIGHESRANIDPQIRYFVTGTNMGTQSPAAGMNFGGNISEALSRTIERDILKDVSGFQRFLRRKMMRHIFAEVLRDNGFDDEEQQELGIRIRWGPITRIEITMDNVISLGQGNFLGRNEVREFVSRGGFPLSDNPEYMGIQGGATVTEEGEAQGSGAKGYEKDQASTDATEGEGGPKKDDKN